MCFAVCIPTTSCYHLAVTKSQRSVGAGDPWAGLTTEATNPRTRDLDTLSARAVARRIAAEDVRAIRAAAAAADRLAPIAELFAAAIRSGRRVLYVGAGTSGRLGVLDAAELVPTYGMPLRGPGSALGRIAGGWTALRRSVEGAEDDERAGRAAVADLRLGAGDLVIGISASSLAPYVRAALAEAKRRGAATALLTMNRVKRPLFVDLLVDVPVGPEVVAGSTRMKSGLATKAMLHTISTTALILVGKVYGNRMVDLKTWCAKLEARGLRMVMEIGRVSRAKARRLLVESRGEVRTAIVMARLGLGPAAARRAVRGCGGRLRGLLGSP